MIHFDFTIGTRSYRSRRLDPFKQTAILKRVLPLLGPLIPLISEMESGGTLKRSPLEILGELMGPLALAFSTLKDEDLNWLQETCLATVQIQNDEGAYVPFWIKGARKSAFDDLDDASIYLPITIRVIRENLTPFFLAMVTDRQVSATES